MLRPSAGTRSHSPVRRQPPTIQPTSGHEKQKRPVNRAISAPDEDAAKLCTMWHTMSGQTGFANQARLAASNDTSPPMLVPCPKNRCVNAVARHSGLVLVHHSWSMAPPMNSINSSYSTPDKRPVAFNRRPHSAAASLVPPLISTIQQTVHPHLQ